MADNLITQTISTTDAAVVVGCADNPLVSIEVSGTWAGTLNIETNLDPDNAIWRAAKVFTEANVGASASISANGRWIIQAAGVGQVRARLNPATSGAAVVTLRAGDNETFGLSGGGGGGGGGAVTVADGSDIALGTTTDTGIITNVAGTVIGFLRGNILMWLNFLARLPAALVGGRLDTNVGAIPGTLSTVNSSTATLTGNAVFTGTAEDVTGVAVIGISVFADVASAAGGVVAQFSSNGTNWDISDTVTALVAAGVGQALFVKPRARFFRLVYTNGVTNQAAFRLQTVFHPVALQAGTEVARANNTGGAGLLGIGPLLKSVVHGAAPGAVSTVGNVINWLSDAFGIPFVAVGHPHSISHSINYTGAQTNTVVLANSAGTKWVVTSILAQASAANTGNIAIGVGLAQTVTPPSGTAGRLGGSAAVAPGSGFGKRCYQAGADGDQLLVTSVGSGDFTVTFEAHTVPS